MLRGPLRNTPNRVVDEKNNRYVEKFNHAKNVITQQCNGNSGKGASPCKEEDEREQKKVRQSELNVWRKVRNTRDYDFREVLTKAQPIKQIGEIKINKRRVVVQITKPTNGGLVPPVSNGLNSTREEAVV